MDEFPVQPLVFMSEDHVAALNARFRTSSELLRAAAGLPREITWAHRLWDDVAEREIWWHTRFSPEEGVSFALTPPPRRPDLQMAGNYWRMVAATKEHAEGKAAEFDLTIEIAEDDAQSGVGDLLALAWSIGGMDVTYPSRPTAPDDRA